MRSLGSAEVGREVGQLKDVDEFGFDGREVAVVTGDSHLVLAEQGAEPVDLSVDQEGPVLTEAEGHALVQGVGEAVAVEDRPSHVGDDEATELLQLGGLEIFASLVLVAQVGRDWHGQVWLHVDEGLAVLAILDRVVLPSSRGAQVDQLEAGHDEIHAGQCSDLRGLAADQ